ncbi:hypothetical protein GCM10009678_19440 [Actinomadura kijaniata]|uniref:Tetratricopeptide (TPR) repeat protein n=1 Tax=Actinomadura namibiensis TaxID=182080 RepID=A0A7W3QQY9_ACTNM|nr:hypothetical protein [Actinomadura namibiensis]MBA8956189.1 tetratricopeptide (TPR) repeat protein [Actinomadura namibiensis]
MHDPHPGYDSPAFEPDGFPVPLPADPVPPVPEEVESALEPFRAGDAAASLAALRPLAASGRTSLAGHAAAALAGVAISLDEPFRAPLRQVMEGEDPWLGPLAAVLESRGPSDVLGRRPSAVDPLLTGITARLTGAREAAREHLAQAVADADRAVRRDLAAVLLGDLLLADGEPDAAERPLRRALRAKDPLYVAYAGHLLGHLLIVRGELDEAADTLLKACITAHPRETETDALMPWVHLRLGELLAGTFRLRVVEEWMENNGMNELYWTRDVFETGLHFHDISRPSLNEIGLHVFPGDVAEVRAALDRLKQWSDERHARGRRLCLMLGTRTDTRPWDEGYGPLRELLAELNASA